VNPPPCKLYPKIFGGALDETYTFAMDANFSVNKIVVAGFTKDSGLFGVQQNGQSATFIAAFSILSTSIYWAKGDR
jgi:hypothetical protein